MFDPKMAGYSPDRVDALVWALSELMVEQDPFEGWMEFYRQDLERMAAVANRRVRCSIDSRERRGMTASFR
jgi:hypothetical protein